MSVETRPARAQTSEDFFVWAKVVSLQEVSWLQGMSSSFNHKIYYYRTF